MKTLRRLALISFAVVSLGISGCCSGGYSYCGWNIGHWWDSGGSGCCCAPCGDPCDPCDTRGCSGGWGHPSCPSGDRDRVETRSCAPAPVQCAPPAGGGPAVTRR